MTLADLIAYHKKQAKHFEPFGAENALTLFHRSAVETLETAIERETCAIRLLDAYRSLP